MRFRFSPDTETSMGLVQHEGGPCSVLATIQAEIIISKLTKEKKWSNQERENLHWEVVDGPDDSIKHHVLNGNEYKALPHVDTDVGLQSLTVMWHLRHCHALYRYWLLNKNGIN
ncbi:uncharacterized protein LOC141684788 isoform X1 [Apium graveolens]|uniref:uncharacterized protein LOC141684788 isoform X1 n=1 Tax=Apium graveolens TaxID=4045 RepID=UPI003D7B3642